MSKILDWSKIPDKTAFDDNRRAELGIKPFKVLMEEAYKKQDQQEQQAELIKSQEAILRSNLLKHMINKLPIQIYAPIVNWTEMLSGTAQEGDELDSFYYNGGRSQDLAKSTENARFEIAQETIPSGIELVFKSWNKTLGQWIFKASNGKEYNIYDSDNVMIGPGRSEKNTGLYGLLFNTSLTNNLREKEGEK